MNLLYIATNSCKPVAESELYYIYSYLQLQKELTSAAYVGNSYGYITIDNITSYIKGPCIQFSTIINCIMFD